HMMDFKGLHTLLRIIGLGSLVWMGFIQSAYYVILGVSVLDEAQSDDEMRLLAKVWKHIAPSKVLVFAWQLLQDRVPTRQNLFRLRVIVDTMRVSCVFCGNSSGSSSHLFVTCAFAV
ncbi:putative ribonuclease H protein, partial [Trifolium medium]|nr:putative ribonuclease H protein [Trifolium medium]